MKVYAEEKIRNAIDITFGDNGSKGDLILKNLRTEYTRTQGKVMDRNEQGDYVYPADMVIEVVNRTLGDGGLRIHEIIRIMDL